MVSLTEHCQEIRGQAASSWRHSGTRGQRVAAWRGSVAAFEDLSRRLFGSESDNLSDGQRRCLLLARVLVHAPELWVLDEPTNGLDLRAKHQLLAHWRLCSTPPFR